MKQKCLWLAVTAALLTPVVSAAPVWISIGDKGYQLLKKIKPQSHRVAQQQLGNDSGAPLSLRSIAPSTETVHIVQVDDSLLPTLSEAIHHSEGHCGGYIVHSSRTEALKEVKQTAQSSLAIAKLAPSYVLNDQAKVTPLLNQVQEGNLIATINGLSSFQNRFYTTTHGVAASGWLLKQWQQLASSRPDIKVEQITHSGYPQKSVVLTIPGSDNAREIVVLGAHLDSTIGNTTESSRSPGADDDASGVANLTETIRILASSNFKPRRTLKFMAYAAEEAGLRGSGDLAARHKQQNANVVGVLQLDMTNYQGSPEDILLYTDYTNAAQNEFVARLISTYQPGLKVGYDKCNYGCSDHASWHRQGYAATLPFESRFKDYNPHIHTSGDTLANMGNQAKHAMKFTKLALSYAVELGSDGKAAVR